MKTEDSVSIKQINTERIRAFMEQEGPVSKSQVARQLGLSFPTVTRLLEELGASGEVLTQGMGTSTGGRCPCHYRLNPDYRLFLLIQVEDGHMRWSLKNLDKETVEQAEVSFQGFSLEKLDRLILDIAGRYGQLKAAAVGIAALVSRGMVEESGSFPCLHGINLTEHVKSLTPVPVVLDNDMNYLTMGCWNSYRFRADSLITLYMGSCGMGGGMVIDNRLWAGTSGFCEPAFLPFMEPYWEELGRHPKTMDVTELYTRLIQIYTFTVNPAMIVLYWHPLLEGKLDQIRRSCAALMPAKALPAIELSRSYQEDYENGLFAVARRHS